MKQLKYILILGLLTLVPICSLAQQTIDELHGDENYSFRGWHSGNMIRTCFYNDGNVGWRTTEPDGFGEWPINSGHTYINLITYFFGAEVKDREGLIQHIISEGNGVVAGDGSHPASGDADAAGNWQCMAPLPGFANEEVQEIAMSHKQESWPDTWPDKFDDTIDPGWPGSWNGYFGKNILNADQESYYVMDDYLNNEFAFYPDSTDSLRRGLGLRGTVRGFQWSNVLVEDILFQLVDIKNIGTTDHAKMNFGIVSGPVIGRSASNDGDGSDDGASFDLQRKFGWHWDLDDIGAGGWTPVGKHGFAFYESPGNPYDGIDNDDDAINGSGPIIDKSMFEPVTLRVGDPIILIDYDTFERKVTTMPAEGIIFTYLENRYHISADSAIKEIENNLIDDNLNGLIDESNGYVFGEGETAVANYLNVGRKYIDYFTGEGLDNPLIEERRDDGVDNDGDWDIINDDVGLDGVPNTGDYGEGDGMPTSGRGTDLPGEPHIDKTDIDESDMIGLTAFNIFIWGNPQFNDDQGMWDAILPGFLNAYGQYGDTDLMLGSGFFPLKAGDIERFSIGIMFGESEEDIFANHAFGEKTYHENYNFSKAPYIPTLTAIPGDNKVTLIWDDYAEESKDPITGYDFEGYRIYRSTDPGWNDMKALTDYAGVESSIRLPIAQFDIKDNGIEGYANVDIRGIRFYLGSNTGITHSFVDTTAKNGFTYYYAVTSYDRGSDSLGIAPTECSKYVSINQEGEVDKGKNVQIVRPAAPAAGHVPADFDSSKVTRLAGSTTTALISYEVINPHAIKNDHVYKIIAEDTVTGSFNIPATKNISVINVTTGDTLIDKYSDIGVESALPIVEGFRLLIYDNVPQLAFNEEQSSWNRAGIYGGTVRIYRYRNQPYEYIPSNFELRMGELGIDTSKVYIRGTKEIPAIPVNFTVINTLTNEPVDFAFSERDVNEGEEGKFTCRTAGTRSDEIILLAGEGVSSWAIYMSAGSDSLNPEAGDVLTLNFDFPLLSHDSFQFTTKSSYVDPEQAKKELDKIKVVPNPYVVANSWEPQNPYSSGRGPRELHFTHLPPQCVIKIFTVRGQLVQTIEHEAESWNGTEVWDMLTKDNLDISYGIYIYHVDAQGIGEKVGKFAVIK